MPTRQSGASPALSQDSARPNPYRTPLQAINAINRLHREALGISAAARIAGRYTPEQCRRMREISVENQIARQRLDAPPPAFPPEPIRLDPEHGMYPLEVNLEGATRHSRHCKALFNRSDWSCHRCCEMMRGAAPRKGWQREFFARKLANLRRHFLW